MRFYVKVEDGDVVDGPKPISGSPTDAPNTDWGADQMLKHGFYEVDLTHDEYTEKIDYENPTVMEDYVVYPRIPLQADEKAIKENSYSHYQRLKEYPSDNEKLEALWAKVVNDDDSLILEVQQKIDNINAKYPIK